MEMGLVVAQGGYDTFWDWFTGVVLCCMFKTRHREVIMLPPVQRWPGILMRLLCSLYAALMCRFLV